MRLIILGVLVSLIASSHAASAQTVGVWNANDQFHSRIGVDGVIANVAVSGTAAAIFVKDYPTSFVEIWDYTDPVSPVFRSTIPIGTSNYLRPAMVINENILVIHPRAGALQTLLYDLSDPSNPVLLDTLVPEVGWKGPVVSEDHIVYMVIMNAVHAYDISDPIEPFFLGESASAADPEGACVEDGLLYVADARYGLRIYSVADPAAIVELGGIELDNFVMGVDADAGIAAISGTAKTSFVDVSDPTAPVLLSQVDAEQNAPSVLIRSGYAFIGSEEGVLRYDVTDPTKPKYDRILSGASILGGARVEQSESHVFISGANQLYVFDESSPMMDHRLGGGASGAQRITGLRIHNGYGIAIDRRSGADALIVIDLDDPHSLEIVSEHEVVDTIAPSFGIYNDFAYFSHGSMVSVVDLSDPANSAVVYEWDLEPTHGVSSIQEVFVDGDMLYLCENSNNVLRYYIGVLTEPMSMTPYQTGFTADSETQYHIEDGYMVCIQLRHDWTEEWILPDVIKVWDVSNPLSRTLIGERLSSGNYSGRFSGGIDIDQGTLIISRGEYGNFISSVASEGQLVFFDLENGLDFLSRLTFVAGLTHQGFVSFDTWYDPHGGSVQGFAIDHDILYAPMSGDSLKVTSIEMIDISNPVMPVHLGSASIPTSNVDQSQASIVHDGRLYLSKKQYNSGIIEVYDVSGNPNICAADITGDGVLDVFDVFAYLDLFNASDPAADLTGDGSFDIFDIFVYLDAYSAGCP